MNTRIFWLLTSLCTAASLNAQNAGTSRPISVNIVKEVNPANINIVESSLEFMDKTGNKAIDANEACTIRFEVSNTGRGDGIGCKAMVKMSGTTSGLTAQSVSLPTIIAGGKQTVTIPVTANMKTQDGIVNFTIEVTEPQGFGSDPIELAVATRSFEAPMLRVVDYAVVSSTGGSQLQKKQPFDLQLMLQNTQYGEAENVRVELKLPQGIYLMDGQELTSIASLVGGQTRSLEYQLIVPNNYEQTTIPIQVAISEKYGKYAENKSITLSLNQTLASSKLTIDAIDQQREGIQIAQIGSAVDKNIPVTNIKNSNTFAVIIANENYKRVEKVPFAMNDGNIFREYCIRTLGIPEKNVHYVANATGNEIKAQVSWLQTILEVFDNPKVIFYYAGHGIPDESSKTAYLLPVDGVGTDVTTGYKLDDLYATLGKMPADHITIFMDACFSGSKREEGMLAQARGVAIKAKSGQPQGNMVVFSAATGDETAYPNKEQGHGMFTYYLLKKLQDAKGDVTLQELGDYITKNVRQQSIVINGKSQTPTVTPAAAVVSEWGSWKLK